MNEFITSLLGKHCFLEYYPVDYYDALLVFIDESQKNGIIESYEYYKKQFVYPKIKNVFEIVGISENHLFLKSFKNNKLFKVCFTEIALCE